MWNRLDEPLEREQRPGIPVEVKIGLAAIVVVAGATLAHLSNKVATNVVEAKRQEATIARAQTFNEGTKTRTVTSVLDQDPGTVGSIRPRPPQQVPAR
jgi:uncharacterized protein (UPF0333 family)